MTDSALIIDGCWNRRSRVRALFRSAGMQAWEARNGLDGLAILRRRSFRIIAVEMSPPDMQGNELLRRIQCDKRQAAVMILCDAKNIIHDPVVLGEDAVFAVNREASIVKLREIIRALITAPTGVS